jgi:hypothetical protein
MKIFMVILIVISNMVLGQSLKFNGEFGDFNSAASFDLDLNGNFYISDILDNAIIKLDSTGSEILTIGGYGWEESAFDEPVSVFTNTLSVYVADKNNDRIQRFDKDLNFLSLYSGRNNSNIEFGYPTCIVITDIGDLFFLESDNNRILKFNLTGEFLLEIGGNDAGAFALTNPTNFSSDADGNIYVLDKNKVKVFDQYGNGKFIFSLDFQPNKIFIYRNRIFYIQKSRITVYDLKDRRIINEYKHFDNLMEEEIIDAKIKSSKLFVLTPSRILKYMISK